MKNYILCSRCQCRIKEGEKFTLVDVMGGSPDNPYCDCCAGTDYVLEKDDPYIKEFWESEHKDWADDADEENEEDDDND